MKINWINSWKAANKKPKYYLECRIGTFTLIDVKKQNGKFRFMLCNLGFEI